MNLPRAVARLLVLLVACAGCATSGGSGRDTEGEPVAVVVTNQNRRDAAIYWVASGVRVRLGTTVAGGRSRFVVRNTHQAALSNVQLSAALIGSGEEYTTGRIMVSPGQRIDLMLQDLLVSSEFSVTEEEAARRP